MTKYFSVKELACSHCNVNGMQQPMLEKLDLFRVRWGKPLVLTSAYRCEFHNKAIGGAPNSQHVKGLAVDVTWSSYTGKEKAALLKLAMEIFTGIGLHKQFLHVDDRPGEQLVWFY